MSLILTLHVLTSSVNFSPASMCSIWSLVRSLLVNLRYVCSNFSQDKAQQSHPYCQLSLLVIITSPLILNLSKTAVGVSLRVWLHITAGDSKADQSTKVSTLILWHLSVKDRSQPQEFPGPCLISIWWVTWNLSWSWHQWVVCIKSCPVCWVCWLGK